MSLSLLTDLYQLTMAYGYWKLGRADQGAVFHLFFRRPPFRGGYAVAAGLGPIVDFLSRFSIDQSDVDYLATLTGNDDRPLFESDFLAYLQQLELTCDIDAMPEGTVAFGQEPLLRVRGPLLQCQILETPLLNMVNFQTLIATKASRICQATRGEPVLEFGLRRAQGVDGGLAASRAAYVGGCAATSNVLAGKLFGIPVRGTHAHSWVMSFDQELEAFDAYAQVMPNNAVFLVDTYDTLEGVRRAVEVGRRLRDKGHEMLGIRLDSGDLTRLSIDARQILDDAGFPDAAIVASNDLDEHVIAELKSHGAKISVWGVGTRLATGYDQPALGGVYKLGAMQDADGRWHPKIKLSEQPIKMSIPGILQVRRYESDGRFVGDVVFDQSIGCAPDRAMVNLKTPHGRSTPPADADTCDLLQPVMRSGKVVGALGSADDARSRARGQLLKLDASVRRFSGPSDYPVGIDVGLHELRERLVEEARRAVGVLAVGSERTAEGEAEVEGAGGAFDRGAINDYRDTGSD